MGRTIHRGRVAVALTAVAVLAGAQPVYGIAGGTPAADGQYGFVAHLQIGDHVRACTGALVDPEWVVTAAACFAEDGGPVPAGRPALATTATVGRADLTTGTGGAVRTVSELVPHPDRDVVLARLAAPVIDVTPAAVAATAPAAGEELQVAGFGRTATAWTPGRLHTTALAVQSVAGTTIDLTGPAGGAVCKGDAGGPTWRVRADGGVDLVGVHSASNQSGCLAVPDTGEPARATDTRLDTIAGWIAQTVRGGWFSRFTVGVPVLDTRSGLGGTTGVRPAGSTTTFPVAGVGGVPATGVTAVLIDLTVITGDSASNLTAFPAGTTRPAALTSLHARARQTISNSVVVNVPADGRLSVATTAGGVHIVADVQGYYTGAAGTGGGYVPVRPTGLIDTRSGLGGSDQPLPAGGSRTFTLTGGVIPAGTTAAYLNLIAVGATAPGYLGVHPTGATTRSVMNYVPGFTAHGITARIGADGRVTFSNGGSDPVDLVVTAAGYYTAAVTGGGLRTLPARRVLDTRSGTETPLVANATVDVPVGLPPGSVAAVNLIVVGNAERGYLRAWPVGGTEPTTSLANYPDAGAGPRSAAAMVPVGSGGRIRIRNVSAGTTHVVVDLQGWHAP